jgi:hypothetical protein
MVIDIHCHAYLNPLVSKSPTSTPFLSSDEQIRLMDEKGIDKAVILPLNSPEAPGEKQSLGEVLAICERHPGRFVPFCNVDPRIARRPQDVTLDDYRFILGQHKEHGCTGLGELTARIPWDHPQMLMLLQVCEELDLPVIFHTITPEVNNYGVLDEIGMPLFDKVVTRFPSLPFIGHSPGFWNEISGSVSAAEKNGYPKGPVEPGGRLVELLREHDNVWCDISAGSGLNALTRDPGHAFLFLEEFQDRVCLGLDQNNAHRDMEHLQWLTSQRQAGTISPEVYEKIVWRNADRVLRLGLTAGSAADGI